MEHGDHVALIRAAVSPGETWADLGAGNGAFTLALAEVLGAGGTIYAVDRDARALGEAALRVGATAQPPALYTTAGDFTRPLALPPLDGIVMANSLHFVGDPLPVLRAVVNLLRPGGSFVLVEYDADVGNQWVPHPISAARWPSVAAAAGLVDTREIGRRPSRFLSAIYAAVSVRPQAGAPREIALQRREGGPEATGSVQQGILGRLYQQIDQFLNRDFTPGQRIGA